jgi:hypothetical protein
MIAEVPDETRDLFSKRIRLMAPLLKAWKLPERAVRQLPLQLITQPLPPAVGLRFLLTALLTPVPTGALAEPDADARRRPGGDDC